VVFYYGTSQLQLAVCHRVPAAVALSDLVGAWNLVQFQTPARLTNDVNNVLQGGDNFAVTNGTLTVSANGKISGILGDAFTGSITVGANGSINANIISSGGVSQPYTFFINAGKDTMTEVATQLDANDNEQQIVIAHRIPAD